MESKLERLRVVEYRLQKVEEEYAQKIAELTKKRGYDVYSPKWSNKIDKLAEQYAKILYPLKKEHDELREALNKEEVENWRKQFKSSDENPN